MHRRARTATSRLGERLAPSTAESQDWAACADQDLVQGWRGEMRRAAESAVRFVGAEDDEISADAGGSLEDFISGDAFFDDAPRSAPEFGFFGDQGDEVTLGAFEQLGSADEIARLCMLDDMEQGEARLVFLGDGEGEGERGFGGWAEVRGIEDRGELFA